MRSAWARKDYKALGRRCAGSRFVIRRFFLDDIILISILFHFFVSEILV